MKDCSKKTCCELCKKRKVEEKPALLSILESKFKGKSIVITDTRRKKVYDESKLKPYH